MRSTHRRFTAIVVVTGTMLGSLVFLAAQPAARLREIASESFIPEQARTALDDRTLIEVEADRDTGDSFRRMLETRILPAEPNIDPSAVTLVGFTLATAASPELPDEMFTSVLLIGADASGALADVIILGLLPADGSAPILASFPRDLYLPNPCTEDFTRVNQALNGCSARATGPELLALMLEDYTGIAVDHYTRVNFQGFVQVIDWMGGVTICVDAPSRDAKAHLDIPAGCQTAGGETALAWVRSRNTEQLIDGEWRLVAGSDYARQARQQALIIQLASRLAAYTSLTNLNEALGNLSSAVKMDAGWSIGEVASLGYDYRDLDPDTIIRLSIPTEDYRTNGGAQVLLPTETFNQTLAGVYPAALVSPD